jgi:hypothetical protein
LPEVAPPALPRRSGPGISFPVWVWNGTRYAATRRTISDSQLSKIEAKFLP